MIRQTLSELVNKKHNLILVGESSSTTTMDLRRNIIKRANDNRLEDQHHYVLGVEGVIRDDMTEEIFIKQTCACDKEGFVYGCDDDFAMNFVHVMRIYSALSQHNPDQETKWKNMVKKYEFLFQVCVSDKLREHWRNIKSELEGDAEILYNGIHKYICSIDYRKVGNRAGDFSSNDKSPPDVWGRIFRQLAISMSKQAELSWSELKKAQEAISNPGTASAKNFVEHDLRVKWRGEYLFENMKYIAETAREKIPELEEKEKEDMEELNKKRIIMGMPQFPMPQKKDLDMCFIMNSIHVRNISKLFGYSAMGFYKHEYNSLEQLPDKFRP